MLIVDQYGNPIKEEDYPTQENKLDGSWMIFKGIGDLKDYSFSIKSNPLFHLTDEQAKTAGFYYNGQRLWQ